MTALHSKISWTIGTLNLTVGCDSLSAACDNCHARRHVGRGLHGSRDFETLQLFPERLRDLRKFRPARGEETGSSIPRWCLSTRSAISGTPTYPSSSSTTRSTGSSSTRTRSCKS